MKLEQCLKTHCPPLYERLRNPVDDGLIDSVLSKWDLEDDVIMKIYQWKDGIAYEEAFPTHCFDFTGFGVIPPLDYVDQVLQLATNNGWWSKTFFPLICNFAGDFLLYETNEKSDNYKAIFLFSPTLGYVDYLPKYFDSVFTMINTIVENFEAGAFRYENMFLEIDYDLRSTISTNLNPASDYWKE